MSEYALTVDEAMNRLAVIPDYDPGTGPGPCVHSFREAGFGLIGAHWYINDARKAMEEHGVEVSGDQAQAMHHGLVVIDKAGPIFFETKGTA